MHKKYIIVYEDIFKSAIDAVCYQLNLFTFVTNKSLMLSYNSDPNELAHKNVKNISVLFLSC